ncbi:hypothetical protein K439DRAFT_1623579 [Ramaria rubella]|nr:hypothetical protein K439DRAFT_1623579 [Ramaria rubella]
MPGVLACPISVQTVKGLAHTALPSKKLIASGSRQALVHERCDKPSRDYSQDGASHRALTQRRRVHSISMNDLEKRPGYNSRDGGGNLRTSGLRHYKLKMILPNKRQKLNHPLTTDEVVSSFALADQDIYEVRTRRLKLPVKEKNSANQKAKNQALLLKIKEAERRLTDIELQVLRNSMDTPTSMIDSFLFRLKRWL